MMPRSRLVKINLVHLAVVAALLPGCALMGPDYKRPDNTVPAQFSEKDVAQEQASAQISTTWWELYQDPVLNDLVVKARQNNTDIKLAVARVEEADAFMREVGAALLPQIDLDSRASRSRVTQLGSTPIFSGVKPIRNNYNITLGTSFELDFWGKLRRAKESARAQALATHYAKDTVDLSLSSLVASNYLLLRSLEAQITVSRDSLRSREESLALTKRRLQGGVSSALDVHQAEVTSSNLVAQIADLVRQRAVTEHQLA
ncbi:MAG: TolC family protein, partial [Methylophilaceae bacterium]